MSRIREILDRVLDYHLTKPQRDSSVLPNIQPIIEELRTALFAGCLQRKRLERCFREAGLHEAWLELSAKVDPGLLAIYKTVQPFGLGFSFLLALEQQEREAQRLKKEEEHNEDN